MRKIANIKKKIKRKTLDIKNLMRPSRARFRSARSCTISPNLARSRFCKIVHDFESCTTSNRARLRIVHHFDLPQMVTSCTISVLLNRARFRFCQVVHDFTKSSMPHGHVPTCGCAMKFANSNAYTTYVERFSCKRYVPFLLRS